MSGNPDMEILRTIYASEVSRVRYLLRSYLRTRLLKIEKHVMHILDNPLLQSRLSEKEASYAREYFLLIGNHFKASIATHLPDAFSSLVRQASAHPNKDMIPTPDLNKHVFCQVVVDQGPVVVDEQTGDTADFNKGDVFVVRYKPIKELVENGSVRLI
jgi:GINS complex subunit 4